MSQICDMSPRAIESAAGNLASNKGIGEPLITDFLKGVPGINESTVKHQLANLKASGEYAHIIKAVQEEIERENKEALQALARAEREQKAAEEPHGFDCQVATTEQQRKRVMGDDAEAGKK
jgi:hypothetical protein